MKTYWLMVDGRTSSVTPKLVFLCTAGSDSSLAADNLYVYPDSSIATGVTPYCAVSHGASLGQSGRTIFYECHE